MSEDAALQSARMAIRRVGGDQWRRAPDLRLRALQTAEALLSAYEDELGATARPKQP
jgi:hypothetical protein